MAAKTETHRLIKNILADLSVMIGALLLLITYDNFEHGSSYLFVALAGAITALLGMAGGICRLWFKSWFYFFTRWFSIYGLFFIFSYWLVDTNIFKNLAFVFFSLFWLFSLAFIVLNHIKQKTSYTKHLKENIELVFLFGTLAAAVWLLPLENRLSLVQSPNQSGTRTFINRDYSLNINGGFLYRINPATPIDPEEIIIKQTAPETNIKINNQQPQTIRLNILNSTNQHQLTVNGRVIDKSPYAGGERLAMDLANDLSLDSNVVYSKDYTGARKGYRTDIKFDKGESNISIKPPITNDELSFYILSDLHSGYSVNFKELTAIIKANPDFIVFNGDVVNYGIKPEYIVAAGLAEMSPVPIYTVIGNHEDWQNGAKFYKDYFGPFTNSFTYKDCLVVFIDTHTGYIGPDQFNWLKATLKDSTVKHKLVFGHMSPINSGSGTYDEAEYRYEEMRKSLFDKYESNQLIKILNDYGAELYFGAHSHISGDYQIGSTRFINSGAMGGAVVGGNDVSYWSVKIASQPQITKVVVQDLIQVAGNEFSNKAHMVKIFAGPFLLDKAIRLNTSLLLIILASYLIKKKALINKKSPVKKR